MLAAGGLDPTFGNGGIVTTSIGSDAGATSILAEPDGKIVAGGCATVGGKQEFALTRYNADGSLDTTFGTDGVVTTAIGVDNSQIYGLALQSDGEIVAVGNSFDGSRLNFTLARYNDDGTLDTSFGQGGIVTAPVGTVEAEAFAVAIQPDGRIVVGGNSEQAVTLARYLPNGTLDPSFGTGGVDVVHDPFLLGNAAPGNINALAIEPDGKIVAVGGGPDSSMVRVNADGSLDQSFGTNGFVQMRVGNSWDSQSVVLQPDGKILVGAIVVTQFAAKPKPPVPPGTVQTDNEIQDPAYVWFGLARYNSDGSLDSSFGSGGIVTTQVGGGADSLNGLSLEPDGHIVAGGGAEIDPDAGDAQSAFAAAVYNADGTLDTAFANGGTFVSPSGPTRGGGFTSTLDSQGRILIAGAAGSQSQNLNFGVDRVTTGGNVVSGAGRTITTTEGVATGTQAVATFTDPANLPLPDYSAEIDWGDGTTSAGTVSLDASSSVYSVSGNHTYAEDGSEPITVTVHRAAASDLTFEGTASVVEPPLVTGNVATDHIVVVQEGVLQNFFIGTFTHGANSEPASDFTVTIDWGDGMSSAGTVSATGTDYLVSGSHIYMHEIDYAIISATVTDISGGVSASLSTATSIAEVAAFTTSTQRFVANAYADLLHRDPDTNGLAYWSAQLDGGATRAQVVAGIENTDEYRHDVVDALFEKYLHRQAEAGSLTNFGNLLAHGASDEQVAAMIVGSDEYFTARGEGTNDGFLNALFEDALNRPIDPAAKATFERFLANGMTREQVAAVVFGTAEYRDDLVAQMYLDVLDRPVDAQGQTYWAAELADGKTHEQVLAGLMASGEYFAKTS